MSFFWRRNALGHAEAFTGVRVVGADLHAGQFGKRHFFGAVVEEDEVQGVAGILCANEMRESHSDALCGSETVFAIQNHAVAAIEQNHGGAGAVILALMDHQVWIGDLDGDFHAVAAHGVEERFADVEI